MQIAMLRWYDALQNKADLLVGDEPYGVAFDGFRTSDGGNLGSFAVGSDPQSVAFDGANFWVVNQGSDTVSKR